MVWAVTTKVRRLFQCGTVRLKRTDSSRHYFISSFYNIGLYVMTGTFKLWVMVKYMSFSIHIMITEWIQSLPTHLPTYRPTDRPITTYLPTYLPTCLPACLPTYLPTYLLTYLLTYLQLLFQWCFYLLLLISSAVYRWLLPLCLSCTNCVKLCKNLRNVLNVIF